MLEEYDEFSTNAREDGFFQESDRFYWGDDKNDIRADFAQIWNVLIRINVLTENFLILKEEEWLAQIFAANDASRRLFGAYCKVKLSPVVEQLKIVEGTLDAYLYCSAEEISNIFEMQEILSLEAIYEITSKVKTCLLLVSQNFS